MKEVSGKDIVKIGIGKRSIIYHISCFVKLQHQAFCSFFWREKPKEMILKEKL